MKIGIIGLGLIGGSLAKAFTTLTTYEVCAWNRNPQTLQKALDNGDISGVLTPEGLAECDLIFLCTFPAAAVQFAEENASHFKKGCLVIDCCGVKGFIYPALQKLAYEYGFTYIGGHPMAGKAYVGYDNATAYLFSGATMLLVTDERIERVDQEFLKDLFAKIGFGRITITTVDEHDRQIAYTSQLSHILTNAYINTPMALDSKGFTGGSFRDLTRTAWLNEEMWSELFLENRGPLLEELDGLIARLSQVRGAIADGDETELQKILRAGREMKEKVDKL